jgi:DNA (cytosine-5)-methyltransferase 1
MNINKIKVVSLFSGGGGLDLGFINAGYDIIWANDTNKDAVMCYQHNIGNHIVCKNIYEIENRDIPNADVIIGGPPCQSFSLAGNRNCDDARGQLVWRYLDILKSHSPKAFLFENVTGLLSAKNSNGEKILPLLTSAFSNLGYTISCQTVNAADYGVPQLRKRVIIVGIKGETKFEFPKPSHNVDGSNGLLKYVSAKEAIGDLPLSIENKEFDHLIPQMSELDKYIVAHVKPGGNYNDIPDDVPSERIKRLKREGGHTTCYGRLSPDKPAHTINTYFNRPNVGCNIHYEYDRLLTIREALRFQTFPDTYQLVCKSKTAKHLIVGNAVPPILAYALAKQLRKYL